MSRTDNPLFFLGKIVYYIGILLLFNFFFGLIFLRFFVWLIAGGILVFLLLGAMVVGKNMLFGAKGNSSVNQEKTYEPNQQASRANNDVIDVEAEIFDDNQRN